MNHNKIKEMIDLLLMNELSVEEMEFVHKHLGECEECRKEFEVKDNIMHMIRDDKSTDETEKLLVEARTELRGALRLEADRKGLAGKFRDRLSFAPASFLKPVFAVALLIAGFTGGYLLNNSSDSSHFKPADLLAQSDVGITNIQFLDSDASDGEIDFSFLAVKPMRIQGNINDQKIKDLLTYSILKGNNPGVRLNSVNAVSFSSHNQSGDEIKQSLIHAARYDDNPGVRLEALKVLNEYEFDEDIKNTFLFVLLNDSTPGVRINAISSLLDKIKSGSSPLNSNDLNLFREKIKNESNTYVRFLANQIIKEN
ncbi:MAG: hypothetical protein Kow0098_01770 [Ignavibacteriaceae bacterium]